MFGVVVKEKDSMSAAVDDRVYMDIDDEWTLQDITLQIAQFRKDIALETQYESSVTALSPFASQKFTNSPHSSVVVVDTNFLISHLAFLKMLVLEHAKKCNLLVIIPWIVLEELDGLKGRSNNSYANSSKLNQPDVANLAQRAISFLHNCLAEKHYGIRGQKIHEKIEKPK
ncbi:1583_t:CDS:2, partial [Cetraspora pellucida]